LSGWVLARLSSLGVMIKGVTSGLIPYLEKANKAKDLPLCSFGDHIPLHFRAEAGGWASASVQVLRPWEDEVALNAVSDKSSHGNTTMLDLRMTKESDGSLFAHIVKVSLSQAHAVNNIIQCKGNASVNVCLFVCFRDASFSKSALHCIGTTRLFHFIALTDHRT